MSKATINRLHTDGNVWIRDNFNLPLDIAIISNNRFKTTLARLVIQNHKPRYIEIADDVLEGDYDVAFSILKHELIHLGLLRQGLPFSDSDSEFINKCMELNVPVTGDVNIVRKRVIMECNKCKTEFVKTRIDKDLFHVDCGGELTFKEYRYI